MIRQSETPGIDQLAAEVVKAVQEWETAREAADDARREETRLRNEASSAWKKADEARTRLDAAVKAKVGAKP